MFESKLAGVLNQVLGSYVHGISTDDLKVAVFKGDVVLTHEAQGGGAERAGTRRTTRVRRGVADDPARALARAREVGR